MTAAASIQRDWEMVHNNGMAHASLRGLLGGDGPLGNEVVVNAQKVQDQPSCLILQEFTEAVEGFEGFYSRLEDIIGLCHLLQKLSS